MNADDWKRVKELHAAAARLSTERIAAFLDVECKGEPEMRAEVESLLAAGAVDDGFLEGSLLDALLGEPAPGQPVRLGGYELYEQIGQGAMGRVYRARELALDRIVAIKLLLPSLLQEQRDIERFQREARAVARLNHPGIVTVHTVGQEGPVHFFAMEYVEGRDLRTELTIDDAATDVAGGLPRERRARWRESARIVMEAADALAHAHDNGIVHRDVKPSNLLLGVDRRVKVVDFGLARDESLGHITRTGETAGTPHYMSPEQAEARRFAIDERTDVYSLGVVLYELLTGRTPFTGRTPYEVISAVLRKQPPALRRLRPDLPRDLETICTRAMAKAPGDRYPDAGALRDDLRRWLAGRAIVARPPTPIERGWRFMLRHRRELAFASAAVLLALVAVAFARREHRRDEVAQLRARLAPELHAELGTLPFGRIARARQLLAELQQRVGTTGLTADERRLDDAIVATGEAWRREGTEDLARSRDASLADGVRELARLRGLRTLMNAALLFPEDRALAELASIESALPRLTVRAQDAAGGSIAATVELRHVPPTRGVPDPPRVVGPAPVRDFPVEPGHYRVVVRFSDGGVRELTRHFGPESMDVEVHAARRADEDELVQAGNGMVRFEGGVHTYPVSSGEFDPRQGIVVELEAFWLDRCEVTIGEYKAFLRAHPDRAAPRYFAHWPEWRKDERHDELPIVGITWYEARDYAEWVGKRLPTAAEWQRAARGVEGRSTPWIAVAADDLWRGNVLADVETHGDDERADWELFVRHAAPVTSHPEAASPEGVLHLLGNVDEYTETVMLDVRGGPAVARHFDRMSFGGCWNARRARWTVARTTYVGIGTSYEIHVRGFRCAKTFEP